MVNGPSRFLCFLGNDELTRNSLTGWGGYRTGDLGYLDDDGHLVYVGRSKDIIRRGGVTIVPAEVEPVLMRHPAIHEAAVVPLIAIEPLEDYNTSAEYRRDLVRAMTRRALERAA